MTPSLLSVLLSAFALWTATDPDSARRSLAPWAAPETSMASIEWIEIPPGVHRPLFAPSPAEAAIQVKAFRLAKEPTTNADFMEFVREHPEWRRDRASRLFVDEAYLSHWAGPSSIDAGGGHRPVTNVSWFAARAFCEAVGGRLPTNVEWERAAAASPTQADGRKDRAWSRAILDWYASPSRGPEHDVGLGPANFWGVRDLHGLVWEWVLDFNSTLVTSDSRNTRSNDKIAFCGAGALGARDPEDYASFMRTAFLSSLEARRVSRHLGFRCAKDIGKEQP